ncbi:hypothetical protein SUGI_0576580 [Cryptomeria japonica]|nr:hypothetical protein SUGI_0576580 [Cryptomeria japonica]
MTIIIIPFRALSFFTFLLLLLHGTSLSHDGVVLLLNKQGNWRDNRNALSDWNEYHQNPCAWTGISCDTFNSVTSVDLTGASISGNLTSTICKLSRLTSLILQRNAFSGPFPHGLLRCKSLQKLDLSQNQFVGTLPARISKLRDLSVLNLADNSFGGSIPPAFGMLTKVEALFFHKNSLNGAFPNFLGNLKSLKNLTFDNNPLRPGVLPIELGNLKQLQQLWLQNCGLVGRIPTFLGSLTQLELLDMSRNQLSGGVSPELGHLKLKFFNVSNNDLSGRIPDALDIPAYKEGFLGNPKLCGGHNLMLPACPSPHMLLPQKLATILLTPLLVASVTLCCCCTLRKSENEDALNNTLENLIKLAAMFVSATITFPISAWTIASKIHNKDQGVATNDKTIAFGMFWLGDVVALITSMTVSMKLAMRSSHTEGLALFGKVGLCSTAAFFTFSFFSLLYLLISSEKYSL